MLLYLFFNYLVLVSGVFIISFAKGVIKITGMVSSLILGAFRVVGNRNFLMKRYQVLNISFD